MTVQNVVTLIEDLINAMREMPDDEYLEGLDEIIDRAKTQADARRHELETEELAEEAEDQKDLGDAE